MLMTTLRKQALSHDQTIDISRKKGVTGIVIKKGSISIYEANPTLRDEWDYEKNGLNTPHNVSSGSKKKIWWICPLNHSYQTTTYHRNARGQGCPYCSGRRFLKGFNDVKTMYPRVAKEWHPSKNENLQAENVFYGSRDYAWWLCSKCSHEWNAIIKNRTHANRGCPKCNGGHSTSFKEQAILFYMKQLFSDALNRHSIQDYEVDIFIPSRGVIIEYDGWRYHQEKVERDTERNKVFSDYEVIRIREDRALEPLDGCHNIMVSESDKGIPDAVRGILDYLKSRGIIHRAVTIDVDTRRDRNLIHDNMEFQEIENSLGSKYPELISEWDTEKNSVLTPFKVTPYSSKLVWWRCKAQNHSWEAPVGNRTRMNSGCPHCVNYTVLEGFNDLTTKSPLIAKEWDYERNEGLKPQEVVVGTNKKIHWICPQGHPFTATVSERTGKNIRDCTECSRDLSILGVLKDSKGIERVRFIYGPREVSVANTFLIDGGINLDLSEVPLLDTTEEDSKLHVLDLTGDSRILRELRSSIHMGFIKTVWNPTF